MGKSSYIGGNTIVYVPNSRKVILKKIHELVSDLLDEDFSFNSIVKVFSEYAEYELHQIEKELFSNNKEKRKYWIETIKRSLLTKSKFSKNKSSSNNNFNLMGDTLKKENMNTNTNSAKDVSIALLEAQIEMLKAKIQKNDWNLSLKRQLKDKEKILLEVKGSIKNKKNYKK